MNLSMSALTLTRNRSATRNNQDLLENSQVAFICDNKQPMYTPPPNAHLNGALHETSSSGRPCSQDSHASPDDHASTRSVFYTKKTDKKKYYLVQNKQLASKIINFAKK